jgi:fatty acid desaturase
MWAPETSLAAPAQREARSREAVSEEFAHSLGLAPAELQALVADLAPQRAAIYWTDLLLTSSLAYALFWLLARQPLASWRGALCLSLCCCAVYRMTLFTHELAHIPQREFRLFRAVWHLVCGVPLLVPSFLYEMHGAHHDRRSYACPADGEYRAFARAPRVEALASVVAAIFAVPALVLRFLLLAPLGWVYPRLRRLLLAKMSALVIDLGYERPLPEALPARWALQEAACFAWCLALLLLTLSGQLSGDVLLRGYLVMTGAVTLNALRVLCAHRYRGSGAPMSFVEQVLDSNNFPEGLAGMWAPLGLRYHAVHHLYPGLPYHALGEAYRRLMQALPRESAFRQTYRQSFFAGLDDVLGRNRRADGCTHEA